MSCRCYTYFESHAFDTMELSFNPNSMKKIHFVNNKFWGWKRGRGWKEGPKIKLFHRFFYCVWYCHKLYIVIHDIFNWNVLGKIMQGKTFNILGLEDSICRCRCWFSQSMTPYTCFSNIRRPQIGRGQFCHKKINKIKFKMNWKKFVIFQRFKMV